MLLPIYFAILAVLFFGIVATVYSLQVENYKKKLHESEHDDFRILYYSLLSMLSHSDSIFSFDLIQILTVLSERVHMYFPYSTLSTLYISQGKLIFTIRLKEQVGNNFVSEIKNNVIQSYTQMDGVLSPQAEDRVLGLVPNDNLALPQSLFHVPYFINGKIAAIFTIASTKPDNYSEKQMLVFYEIADILCRSISGMDRKVASEKNRMLDLLGSLSDGFILFGSNLEILTINNAAKSYLHVTDEGISLNVLLSLLPNTYNFSDKIRESLVSSLQSEAHDININGRIFNVVIKPVKDTSTPDLKTIGATLILHEVTMEKSIAQMKEDFTNIIVHELRSPLTSIKASTQLLDSDVVLTPEEHKKLIGLISTQSNKLLDEVSRILDAAKLETGLFTIQKSPADLRKIIQEKISLFNAQAQERFIKLTTDVDPSLPVFSFDIIHIGQVVNNLLSNSLKFTSSGGEIHLKASQEPGKVIVAVSDTGCGIPKDKQHLLFSKFSQISTPGAHVGTGLGLYITKGIVLAHGGTIMLNSEENKGTTITFTLPIELNIKTSPELSNATQDLTQKSLIN